MNEHHHAPSSTDGRMSGGSLFVVVVSGPIGAGKSSILHAIRACTPYERNVHVFLENMDEWQYYLERFYANPDEYAFLFQKEVDSHMHKLTKRLEQLDEESRKSDENVFVFVERSPLDVLHVFLPLNRDRMSSEDYACLAHSMRRYSERPVWQRAVHFLVSCPARVCKERIKQRNRDGGEYIGDEYVERVVSMYDDLARHTDARIVANYGRQNSLLSSMNIITEFLHR